MAERTPADDLEALERAVRDMCFAEELVPMEGVDEEIQRLYRRMARNNVFGVIRNIAPVARSVVGEEAFDRLVARFLAERPPTTRVLRFVPQEFAAWLLSVEDPPHPALPELVHYEQVRFEVTHAEDAEPRLLPRTPDDDAGIEAHPSARLLAFLHPVHLMKKGDAWPAPTPEPTFLVAYRAGEKMTWVRAAPVVAKTLALTGEGMTLGQALQALEAEHPGQVDPGFVRSQLTDLLHRGALLGFPKPGGDAG